MQSSLGEVLRAEIEVTSLTPEEQASLRIRVAPPESYRAANVDYNPVLPSTRATFEKRADGRLFVRLVSDRGVQEPFVDVILEISWATGRLVREYTLLFDPPATIRAGATPAPGDVDLAGDLGGAAAPTPLAAARRRRRASSAKPRAPKRASAAPRARRRPAAPRPQPRRAAPPARAGAASAGAGEASGDEYRVRSGDTLSKIAGRTQRPGVSLDQMLVSLFRTNPSAFSGNNMNRLKAGVVLSVPSAETAQAIPAGRGAPDDHRAKRRLRRLPPAPCRRRRSATRRGRAEHAPEPAARSQASVDDKKQPAEPSPDKLKLSKGGATPPSAAGQRRGSISRRAPAPGRRPRASPS